MYFLLNQYILDLPLILQDPIISHKFL